MVQHSEEHDSKSPARNFELGDLATNRILFALTLLGVLFPLNGLVNHYQHLMAYAICLLVPPVYIYNWMIQKVGNALSGFSWPLYYVLLFLSGVPLLILAWIALAISERLQD
jgi:hypothetical protein